ncbi:MAG: glycosyltransferase family 39 protein [Chloroflexota bacterium]|nr:glycosyltransferase family 39 protein [Chloroflexota bacterium]
MKANRFFENVSLFFQRHQKWIEFITISAIFLLNLFMVMSRMQPPMLEINPNDGAKYIESGRLLFTWGLRNLSWGPLVAFVYAAIHLFVGNSPNWFMLETWIGNFIFFGMLWISFYLLARQLNKYISRYVIIGLLFSTTVFFPIIENQSDVVFIALAALGLMFMLRFNEDRKLKFVWFSALCVALGVFARVETILLIVPLVVFALVINRKQYKVYKILIATLVPITVLMALFLIVNYITFGGPNLGMSGKSYDSFQMNQAFLPGSRNETAYRSGEAIFGTAEENNYSVLRAVLRNPLAVAERALANLLAIPKSMISFYGGAQALLMTLFSGWGIYALIRRKQWTVLLLLLIWPLHAFVSLIFFSRHIVPQISYAVFMLAATGITYTLSGKSRLIERAILVLIAVGLVIYGIIDGSAIAFTDGLLLVVVGVLAFFDTVKESEALRPMPGMILLIGLMLFGYPFRFPNLAIGTTPEELSAHALLEAVPVGAHTLTPYHTVAIAGKTTSFLLPPSISSTQGLLDFLESRNIQAIYVDSNLPYSSDVVAATLAKYPEAFTLYYDSPEGRIQIYLVNANAQPVSE